MNPAVAAESGQVSCTSSWLARLASPPLDGSTVPEDAIHKGTKYFLIFLPPTTFTAITLFPWHLVAHSSIESQLNRSFKPAHAAG